MMEAIEEFQLKFYMLYSSATLSKRMKVHGIDINIHEMQINNEE